VAQIKAFEDTWHWDKKAEATYLQIVENTSQKVADLIGALRSSLGSNDMMAYLVMMAIRLVELHGVLKPTGSIYLHCDPTANHYIKMLMDSVFDPRNFRNEIIWQRTPAKALTSRQLPNNHDVIFCYQKSDNATWNADEMFQPYDLSNLDEKTARKYCHRDSGGRFYRLDNLINPNPNRPHLTYEFLGVTKVWRWTKERMQAAYEGGLIVQSKPGAVPQLKRYLDEQRGKPFGDVWTDIPPINSQAQERLGYPTQKPEALLERIIKASSNEGDLVLDPFCGCGTTITVAEKLKRKWIGIDITHLAISLMKHRLKNTFGDIGYEVIGEPVDLKGAEALKEEDPYQFQWWALGFVGARPAESEKKRGADKGIDGYIYFHDNPRKLETKKIILQVKSGHVHVSHIRELIGVVNKQNAQIGVFITLENPTSHMKIEAVSEGYYISPLGHKYPKIQILTIEELLEGKKIVRPLDATGIDVTFKKAKRHKKKREQKKLFSS